MEVHIHVINVAPRLMQVVSFTLRPPNCCVSHPWLELGRFSLLEAYLDCSDKGSTKERRSTLLEIELSCNKCLVWTLHQRAIQYKCSTHDGTTCLNYDRVLDMEGWAHTHARTHE